MYWKVKAIIQKTLSYTRVGDVLNHIPATLKKDYHENVFKYQFFECLRKFEQAPIDLRSKSKTALEIGTGYSLISVVVLSLLGFDKIVTVDISKDVSFRTFKKQFTSMNEIIHKNALLEKSKYDAATLDEKIEFILSKNNLQEVLEFCNIQYLPKYQITDIDQLDLTFDYIFSQVVFEHISPAILTTLFAKHQQWLTHDGYAVHTINFIDHFANPGFFQDQRISEFNFLRYSNKTWDFWSGNDITYTNRLSFRYYLDLCQEYKLIVVDFTGENYRGHHPLNLSFVHADVLKMYKSAPRKEDLQKFQRGTLVLKKSNSN